MSTIYVDAAWASKTNGDKVTVNGTEYTIGVDAFATSRAAYVAARDMGGEVTIDLTNAGIESITDGTIGFGNANKDGVYTITGGNGRNTTSYGIYASGTDITVKFEDAAFKIGKAYFANSGSALFVDNSVIGTAYYSGHNSGWFTAGNGNISISDSIFGINYANFTDEEIAGMSRSAAEVAEKKDFWAAASNNNGFHMGTAAEIDVEDSTVSVSWISLVDRGLLTLDNSVLYYGGAISIGTGWVDSSYGSYNSNEIGWDCQVYWGNSPLTSAAGFRDGEVATLTVTDSIVRNLGGGNGGDGAHVQVGGSVGEQLFGGELNLIRSDFSTTLFDADGNAIAKDYDMLVVKSNGTVNMEDSKFTSAKVVNEGKFTVTGASQVNIGTLTGTIDIDNAALTASSINKGSVNFKGNNTFTGDFNATYVFVGDWNNEEYDGSVDFGTASSVNVGGQMIIGYDTLVPGANNVVFGDVTGKTVTDKVFKSADVSVRRDGTLTIANTTGDNRINTMNVMGSVVIDNAKLSGEVQIGGTTNGIMTVQNGAVVNLGGSSNSVVILGKSTKGTLNVDNATVTVKRCGSGGGYSVPADTFVIGYNGGVGELNVTNGGSFIVSDGSATNSVSVNMLVNEGSSVNINGGSLVVENTLTNNGTVAVSGTSTINVAKLSGKQIRFYDAELVGDSVIGGNIFAFDSFTLTGTLSVSQSNLYGNAVFKSGSALTGSITIISSTGTLTIENGADVSSRFFNVMGTANVNGDVVLLHSDPKQKLLQVLDGGVANINAGGNITIDGHCAVVNAGGTLNVVGGALNVNRWDGRDIGGVLYNDGAITINAAGLINAAEITGAGTITIDAADFAGGVVKVVDVNSSTFTGTISVVGNANASVMRGEDGDIFLVAGVTRDAVYVNSAWSDKAVGESIDGKVYGYNAFDNLAEAAAAAGEDTAKMEIAGGTYSNAEGVYSNAVSLLKGGITNVAASGDVVIDKGSLVFATEAAGDVNISGNFTTADKIRYTGTWGVDWAESQNGHIRFVGAADTVFNINGNFYAGENIQFIGGKSIISADSVLSINPANWGQYLINNSEVVNYGKMSLNLNGVNGSAMNIINAGSLTVSGSAASLSINMKDGGDTNKDINVTNGSLIVENGAKVTTGAVTVGAAGTVAVNGAVLDVKKLDVSGEVTVTGESTLNIGTLTGNAIMVQDGAEIADSYIGGRVDLISGESSWSGKNTVTGIFSAGYYNYEEGDITVNITGDFTNGNLLAWNVDGSKTTVNIGAADAERTKFNGGQIGIFENTVVNINNADVSYNYSFIRSDFNVTGSALTCTSVNTYFSGLSKVVVDSSTWAMGAYVTLGGYGVNTAAGSADVTLQNGSTVSVGNLTLAAVTSDAYSVSLTVKDAALTATGTLTVGAGASFNVAADSAVAIGTLAGAGVITVDATGATGNCKVVDVDSSSFSGTINVENLANGMRYEVAADGDIWLLDNSILINAAFGKADAVIPAGYALGVNAFASLEDFSKSESASKGVRTIKYTADKSGALSVNVTSVSGRTDYEIGGVAHYVRAGKTATETLAVTAGNTYEFLFTNASADFDLSADSVVEFNSTEPEDLISEDSTAFNDNYAVSEVLGEKKFAFDVTGTADLSFTVILTDEGRVEYTFLDAQGNQILHGYSSSAFSRSFEELEAGEYTLVVKSLDGDNAEFSIQGSVKYKAIDTELVSAGDDTIDAALIATENTISGWVGDVTGLNGGVSYQDEVDYIDVSDLIQDGRNYFSVTATGSATATLWTRTDGGDWVAKLIWDIHDGTNTRSLRCSVGTQYRVSIESDNDSSYTMQLS